MRPPDLLFAAAWALDFAAERLAELSAANGAALRLAAQVADHARMASEDEAEAEDT